MPPVSFAHVSGPAVLQVVQPEDGGVAEHVLLLSRELGRRGWRVSAVVSPSSTIAAPLRAAGVTVHELAMGREPGRTDVRAARALRAIDRQERPRLVHAHSSKAGALVRLSLRGRRRLVYTPHCLAFAASFDTTRRLAYRAIEQLLVPRTGALVAVCDWERRLAVSELRGIAGRTRMIPNGVDRPDACEPAAELAEFAAGQPLAGMVSVLRPQKDPLLAVRAAARLAPARGRLAIVGNGDLAEAVRSEIERLGVGERVRWFPFEGGMGRYLAALDVFVLPSAWEAFPLSLLEAMACAVPVVATDVGGVAEAVENGVTGRLVGAGDEAALATALAELLDDADLRARLGAGAERAYADRFRVGPMVDSVEALYRELLEEGG